MFNTRNPFSPPQPKPAEKPASPVLKPHLDKSKSNRRYQRALAKGLIEPRPSKKRVAIGIELYKP